MSPASFRPHKIAENLLGRQRGARKTKAYDVLADPVSVRVSDLPDIIKQTLGFGKVCIDMNRPQIYELADINGVHRSIAHQHGQTTMGGHDLRKRDAKKARVM